MNFCLQRWVLERVERPAYLLGRSRNNTKTLRVMYVRKTHVRNGACIVYATLVQRYIERHIDDTDATRCFRLSNKIIIRNRVIVGESIEFNNQLVHCVLEKKSNEMYSRLRAVRFVADSLTRFNGQKVSTSFRKRVIEERSTSQRCVSSRTNMYVGRKETFLQIYTYALSPL